MLRRATVFALIDPELGKVASTLTSTTEVGTK